MNTPDNMECPCLCDCGEWFDLHDGFPSNKTNKVICEKCGDKESKIKELEDELLDAKNTLADAEFTIGQIPELKAEVERIENEIAKLENE